MAVHKFLPNSEERIIDHMLERLGLQDISQLFCDIPESVRFTLPLNIPEALSEIELEKLVSSKLAKNKSVPECLNFIGGGNWVHHVPSIIDEILSRSEFYTAYTPYQPEISQGMLQGLFEYQSQICELTGMDVANSSLYDWGTALGEAGRMANRVTKKKRILVGKNASPERIGVLRTYTYPAGIEIDQVKYDSTGKIDVSSLDSQLDDGTAAFYIENPNFLGVIEDQVDEIVQKCHSKGVLVIVGVNPISLGLLRPPSSYGADIVVGDGQPLGLYPNFGGPLMGIFATREDPNLLRQMPGRLIGATTSKDGSRRGYTMVLQTREQHIRREQATSNICTNEALFALAVSIYLASMGPQGMKEIGQHIVANSNYALKLLQEERFESPFFTGSFFGDVSIKTKNPSTKVSRMLADFNILGGLPLGRFYDELQHVSLFSFNELHSASDIESLVTALKVIEGLK
ncbi:MAG: aminomethyl-transferring glycine dehydrogenase subunit GcvPA [Nitrososphaerales archaeon]|jgi:glycine dehydrogenase subunit 1